MNTIEKEERQVNKSIEKIKLLFLPDSKQIFLGCLKLAYRTNETTLKVVQGGKFFEEKSGAGSYRYGFNGKELDKETGYYNYGMRMYDITDRFISVDPLTKKYPELTPFQFSSDNPIWNIDLDGLEGTHYTDPKQMLYEAGGDISEALANVADKFSAKVDAGYTFFKQLFSKGNTTVSAEKTTTFSAGFTPNTKSFISYVKNTNTSQGAPPLFNIDLDKTTSTAVVTKVKMASLTQTYTLSQDSKGVFKTDASVNYATFLWGIPADITGKVSKTSSGDNTISGGFTLKPFTTDNIKIPTTLSYTQSADGTQKVTVKQGAEVKVGNKSGVKVFGNYSMSLSY